MVGTRSGQSSATATAEGLGKGRQRSNSVKEALAVFPDSIPPSNPSSPLISRQGSLEAMAQEISQRAAKTTKQNGARGERDGFCDDLISWRWMTNPASSAKLILLVGSGYSLWELYYNSIPTPHLAPASPNPFAALLFISYPLPASNATAPLTNGSTLPDQRYDKGRADALFLCFYIIVFSFLRQAITEFGVRPLAIRLGIRGESKLKRFMEQGYALCYFLASASLGLVRTSLPIPSPTPLAGGIDANLRKPNGKLTIVTFCSTLCRRRRRGGIRPSTTGSTTRIGQSMFPRFSTSFRFLFRLCRARAAVEWSVR